MVSKKLENIFTQLEAIDDKFSLGDMEHDEKYESLVKQKYHYFGLITNSLEFLHVAEAGNPLPSPYLRLHSLFSTIGYISQFFQQTDHHVDYKVSDIFLLDFWVTHKKR